MKLNLKNTKIATRITLSFLIVMLSVFIVISASLHNANKLIKGENLIVHTYEVLNGLEKVAGSLLDLETGQRGYLITGDTHYLEPYSASLRIIDSRISFLKEQTLDNPIQTKRIIALQKLIDEKLQELNTTINLRNHVGFEAAKKVVNEHSGKIIMDNIRLLIAEIRAEELRLLDLRVLLPEEAKNNTLILHLTLLILGVLIIILVNVFVVRSIVTPIKILQDSMVHVGQGDLNQKLRISSKDEVGELSNTFERMLLELKKTMASKDLYKKEIESRKKTENRLINVKNNLEKSEQALIESNKTKDKFFSIMAHDLKNPFNSMLGFSNLLMDDFETLSNEKKYYFSKIIHVNIENTYSLLENLLLWSRSQIQMVQFLPEEQNLYLFFDKIIKTLHFPAEIKSIEIKNNIPQDILISVDDNMLSTIIRNLIGNALKFTSRGGEVTVAASIKKGAKEEFVEVVIHDTGVGISANNITNLFNVNNNISTTGTANERGTGLGLLLCKEFVEKHGGTIWVESEIGKGASFFFTLQKASTLEV